ncbi:Deoxyribonuclease II [Tyrophagus putrescentiae]|nr:Deoxyribonuclease II [Tyrophagus putrescentiae]
MIFSRIFLLLGLCAAAAIAAPAASSSSPQCIDESGKAVDWYIVYKFPYLSHLHQKLFGGYRYAVLTSAANDGWHLSANNITDHQNSIFAKTLAPVYGSSSKLSTVFYNDQPPGPESVPSSYAHSKGVVFNYVASGGRYGQVALCISLASAELEKVISHNFLVSQPYVYHSHVASSDSSPLGKAVKKLAAKEWTSTKSFSQTNLTSLAGRAFTSFYKSPGDHVDLYAGIVAPAFKAPLLVETWRKNPGTPLDSECSHPKTKVENVHQIKLSFVNSDETGHFEYTDDHSKWAISSNGGGSDSHVCIGDINRMQSQYKRGGGTTCLSVPSVWKAFNSFVGEVDKCH